MLGKCPGFGGEMERRTNCTKRDIESYAHFGKDRQTTPVGFERQIQIRKRPPSPTPTIRISIPN